jgi:arsenate reductase
VCDNANDTCPVFPGAPRRVHWSLPDPAAVEGTAGERLEAFRRVSGMLTERLERFLAGR